MEFLVYKVIKCTGVWNLFQIIVSLIVLDGFNFVILCKVFFLSNPTNKNSFISVSYFMTQNYKKTLARKYFH